MTRIRLHVNGRPIEADVEPRTHLADFLREHVLLTGTHIGCEHGICGACTVEIDGEIARSCITFAAAVDGAHVRTIEGYDDDPLMARLRAAFQKHHALQCGYCTPGMLVAARDLVSRKQDLSRNDIRTEMSGNLCRCTGYVGIVEAIAETMADEGGTAGEVRASRPLGPSPGPDVPDSFEGAVPGAKAQDHAGLPDPGEAPRNGAEHAGFLDDEAFTTLEHRFLVRHPRDAVWAHMADIRRVAAAMPGVTLDEPVKGDAVTGRIAVKLGPIGASFAGQGWVTRDDAAYTGRVEGSGRDKDSASQARGRVTYTLSEVEGGGTHVDVTLAYALAGPLAQFSRAGLVKDVVARLAEAFAGNLEAQIDAPDRDPEQATELKAGGLVWSAVMARLRTFFRRLFSR